MIPRLIDWFCPGATGVEDRERCLQTGVLTKPLRLERLCEVLTDLEAEVPSMVKTG